MRYGIVVRERHLSRFVVKFCAWFNRLLKPILLLNGDFLHLITIFMQQRKVQRKNVNMQDVERTGRSRMSVSEENFTDVSKMLEENRRVTYHYIKENFVFSGCHISLTTKRAKSQHLNNIVVARFGCTIMICPLKIQFETLKMKIPS